MNLDLYSCLIKTDYETSLSFDDIVKGYSFLKRCLIFSVGKSLKNQNCTKKVSIFKVMNLRP